jgi:16S rRNA (adenine1518-N6/adenine1519-N6)-dimethyltransferase
MNKRLGQHFLKNRNATQKIIAALDLQTNDIVIEIGPGAGALTFPLLEECAAKECKVIAIEKDPKLAYSVQRLADRGNLEIVIGDAIKELPKITNRLALTANRFKVVGNIPYYITGNLLRLLGELVTDYHLPITNVVLMIQKEVAERIVAKPSKMNLLAAATQFWAEPKLLFSLKPADFDPPPKVNSAVIRLIPKKIPNSKLLITNYYRLIHIIFKQPRKTILNNLKSGITASKEEIEAILRKEKIAPDARPQNLTLENIKNLARVFHI